MRQQNHFVLWKRGMYISFILIISVFNSVIISQCNSTSGEISGEIFIDTDYDGVRGSTDTNLSNVLVSAYDLNGIKVAEGLSTTGGYSLAGLTDGETYRVEYMFSSNYQPSSSVLGNNVRFITAPVCDEIFGLQNAEDYCEANPNLAVTCFVRGDQSEWTNLETVVGIERDFDTQSSAFPINTKSETGSVWGLVWRQRSQELFTSSFVKQGASLSSHGPGAIFSTKYLPDGSTSFSLFTDVTDYGIDVGSLPVTDPLDCDYGSQVGKYGLGALALSDDESILYTVNLHKRSLVVIPVNNPAGVTEIPIPDPGCSDGEYAPFALNERNGLIFIGVTCTAETAQSESASSATVFIYNAPTGFISQVFSTSYIKGYWKDDQTERTEIAHWLTDIAFTDEGNMVLSLTDRLGHINCPQTGRTDQQFPDILLVWNNNGTWTLESNGQAGTLTGSGVGNGEGPNGGEFFGDDYWITNPLIHPEVALGSTFVLPGSGEVVATVYDPEVESYSGGLHRYRTSDGTLVGTNELYVHTFDPYFGKATGFGDIEAMCGTIPVSIGNFVWDDTNANGIQDPGESPITGLGISLYDSSCNLVGTTTTDQNGNYYFNNTNVDLDGDGTMDGPSNESTYYVVVDDSNVTPSSGQRIAYNGVDYDVTSINAAGSDSTNDSDAILSDMGCGAGMPVVEVVTGGPGDNNYNFDIGLTSNFIFDLALIKVVRSDSLVRIGDKVGFDITIFNQGTVAAEDIVVSEYMNSGYIFDASENPNWQLNADGIIQARIRGPIGPGESETISIQLEVGPNPSFSSLVNVAEISFAKDAFGEVGDDIDSHPDNDAFNDVGGVPNAPFSDNVIDDDGTIDEDDHDPAAVRFMDLALKKVVQDPQESYNFGDQVCYDIIIYNQGPEPAQSIEVIDYIPEGLNFLTALNQDWIAYNDSTAAYVIQDVLESGDTDTLNICFEISMDFAGENIVNYAEISYMETLTGEPSKDIDSSPNANRYDDAGGVPGGPSDNEIFGRGVTDEDDHDPATLKAKSFDLALTKTSNRTFVEPGDNVTFTITVYNQGTTITDNIEITDYIPAGLSLNDSGWTAGPNSTASTILSVANGSLPVLGLFPNDFATVTIRLQVDQNATALKFTNLAEISGATDDVGSDKTGDDLDSTADTDPTNDVGGTIGTAEDDHILDDGADTNGDGITDEDDSDPACVYLVTSESVTCACVSDGAAGMPDVFKDCYTLYGPPGQTWVINSNTGFTSGTIVEGPAGVYNFCGTHINDAGYSITVVNGQGAKFDFTNSCGPYNPIGIDGPFAICLGSEETFSIIDPIPGVDYEWSVCGSGDLSLWDPVTGTPVTTIIGTSIQVIGENITLPNTTCEITVDIVTPGYEYECTAPGSYDVQVGNPGTSMICIGEINTSLNSDCEFIVTPELLLADGVVQPNVSLTVILSETHGGEPFDSNVLTSEHIGKKIVAKLMDGCSGNSCWTTIMVEDKLPPTIECGAPYDIACYELRDFLPTVEENCSHPVEIILTDEEIIKECDGTYIQTIRRTYIAKDKLGFTSDACDINISVRGVDLNADVICPENFLIADDRAITCNNYPVDGNGHPDPSATGAPYVMSGDKKIPLYPVGEDFLCKLAVTYNDQVTVDSDCKKKIIREWIIFEACDGSSNVTRCPQIIEIDDPIPPTITCPHPLFMDNAGRECGVNVFIPMPEAEDNCSKDIRFELRWAEEGDPDNFGFVPDFQGEELTLSPGIYSMTFTALDGCHATAECSVIYTIDDVTPPVAICDQHTIVSLASDPGGQTHVSAHTFDSGSYDACGLKRIVARRMDTNCECEPPILNRFWYLGEEDGHHYYISEDSLFAPKAFKMAEALGGNVVKINNNTERKVLRELVDGVFAGNYLIGLSDANHEGTFEWQDGTIPPVTWWANDEPSGDGDYVMTNISERWTNFDGSVEKKRFILEIDDPCGFSDYVPFCCQDAGGDPQMVVLRAIDKCGNFNDCMVEAIIQDKYPPITNCPEDVAIDCEYNYDLSDLSEFGTPTVFDQCDFELVETVTDDINSCGVGTIYREFSSQDATGTSNCIQRIFVNKDDVFDFDDIVIPDPYETETCLLEDLLPENLPREFVPRMRPGVEGVCDLLGFNYEDQIFPFADGNACLKILRTWTYIDWCQMVNGEPATFQIQQVIKVSNNVAPVVTLVEEGDLEICTINNDCDEAAIQLIANATDDCTPGQSLFNEFQIDYDSDGSIDSTHVSSGSKINATDTYPVGVHTIFYTFEDRCGNKETVEQTFTIKNCKAPTAACIDGLSVAMVKMDLDGDNVPETPMACLWANDFDASSVHPCGYDITFSFSPDIEDTKLELNCGELGENTIEVYVTDIFGNQSFCQTTVWVTDPSGCCPTSKECIIPPVTPLAPEGCFPDTSPDEIGGFPIIDENCFCDDFEMSYTDATSSDDDGCLVIRRTWTVIARCGAQETCEYIQDIVLENAQPPTLNCPRDTIVRPTNPATGEDCTAFITLLNPRVTSNCNDDVVIVNDSPFGVDANATGNYPLGTTVVTFTATDVCDNEAECEVVIQVTDGTPPICDIDDITITLSDTGDTTIDFSDLNGGETSDVCGRGFTTDLSVDTFTCDDIGREGVTVVVTVTDFALNETSCTANVRVLKSDSPQCITRDITVTLDEDGMVNVRPIMVDNGSTDGCDDENVDLQIDPNGFDCDDIGENIVTLTVSDSEGNSSQCTAIVTVEDDTRPECETNNVTIYINENGEAQVRPFQIGGLSTDNCGVDDVDLSQTEFTCADIGTNIISVTLTDASGNQSTGLCTANVMVQDTIAPVCMANDITITLDENGEASIDVSIAAAGSSDNCALADTVVFPRNFFCNDVGVQTYTLTVTDVNGNTSRCMGEVTIEGDGTPVITCPPDRIIGCDDSITPLSQFGDATLDDEGCASITETSTFNVNSCNVGQITRTFTASSGFSNSVQCTQTIRINGPENPLEEAMITWPQAMVNAEACASLDPDDLGTPIVNMRGVDCALVSINFEDDNTNPMGQCPTVIQRNWTVVDSCQLMRGTLNGIFTFSQSISVNDTDIPVIMLGQDIFIDLDAGQCETDIGLVLARISDCDPNPVVTNDSQYANNNNSPNISGTYPLGVHVVTVTATDFCGNSASEMITITVTGDPQAQDYECKKIIRQIESNRQVTVDITEVTCITGCDVNIVASFSNTNVNDNDIVYTCANLGTGCGGNDQCVDIYFWQNGVVIDSCRNILVTLQDPAGFCAQSGEDASISGKIYTEGGDGIMNTMVMLEGSNQDGYMTNEAGTYAFPNMPMGGEYTINPLKDDKPNNGVSTLDIILIQRHIIGSEVFDSPYKHIAADVNNSRNVSVADLVELRKLILGVYEDFPNNTSWRMIDAGYEFIDPNNPLYEPFPETYEIDNLERDMYINFVGVKIGDINNTAEPNNFSNTEIRSVENLEFDIEMDYISDDQVQLDFYSPNYQSIDGFQFTMSYDPDVIFFQDLVAGNLSVEDGNIGLHKVENGQITFSYHEQNESKTLTQNEKLFSIRFVKVNQGETLQGIQFTSDITRAEAYRGTDILGIEMISSASADFSDAILYQNVPNPWSTNTKVEFFLPESMKINVNFFDITGKLIKEVSGDYLKGRHSLNIDSDDFETSGIIYYELITPHNKYTKKMILLN